MGRVSNVKMGAFMLSSFVLGMNNVEVACKATDVNKCSLQHKTGRCS